MSEPDSKRARSECDGAFNRSATALSLHRHYPNPRTDVPDWRDGRDTLNWDDTFACKTCTVDGPDGRTFIWKEDLSITLDAVAPNPVKYCNHYALPCRGCGEQLVWAATLDWS